MDVALVCNDRQKYIPHSNARLETTRGGPDFCTSPTHVTQHTDTVVHRGVWPPPTSDRALRCGVAFLPHLSHAERWIPRQFGAAAGSAQKI